MMAMTVVSANTSHACDTEYQGPHTYYHHPLPGATQLA